MNKLRIPIVTSVACWLSNATAESITTLPTIYVTEQSQPSYRPTLDPQSAKIDLPSLEIPQSIEIRNRQLMDDLGGPLRVDDLAKTVAGVNQTWQGNGGTNQAMFNIRGFPTNGDSLKDGYRRLGGRQSTSDNAYLEQVEFIKGPTSLLYGNADSLGGQINFISKRPTPQNFARMNFGAGSFDFYRGSLDTGGSLNQDSSLFGRFNAAVETSESFRQYANHNTQSFAPALSYKFSDRDQINLLIDYTQTEMHGDFGLPVTPIYRSLPIWQYNQNPNFDHTSVWSLNTTLEYKHQFANKWQAMLGFSNGLNEWHQDYTRFTPTSNPYVVSWQPNTEHSLWSNRDIEMRMEGHASDWFDFDHHMVYGLSVIENDRNSDHFTSGLSENFNLINPTYGQPFAFPANAPNGIYTVNMTTIAPYAQDFIRFNDYVRLLLGARYDTVHQASQKNQFFGVTASDTQTDAKITPRYAVVVTPQKDLDVYFSYSTSFAQRINNLLDNTNRYKPETGIQYEIGLKHQIQPGLEIDLALYELTRNNAVLTDVRNLDRSYQIGKQRSNGIELDINGQPSEQLRLNANFAVTDARVVYDNVMPTGTKRYGVPLFSGNIFAVYRLNQILQGWEAGGGFNYASGTQVSMPNTFQLPATWQIDLMSSYRVNRNLKVQLNIKNLTNNKNYIATADYGYITPLTPLAFYGNIQYEF
jgi:iron complex outermembrane recepter protein